MADPRGPHRTIASVERTPEANLVRYVECAHVGRTVSHQTVKTGERGRCFACGPHGGR